MKREEVLEYFKNILNEKEKHELSVWTKSNEFKSNLFKTKTDFKIDRFPFCGIITYYVFFGECKSENGKHLEFVIKK